MKESLEQLIKIAQSRFNRREYEQFVLPIIKRLQETDATIKRNTRMADLNAFVNEVTVEVENQKESLQDGKEVIDLRRLYSILDTKKGNIL